MNKKLLVSLAGESYNKIDVENEGIKGRFTHLNPFGTRVSNYVSNGDNSTDSCPSHREPESTFERNGI
jgi:hypothetical protein